MLFTSEVFAIFAAGFFTVYFFLPPRGQNLFCLGASALFYGWWDWRFLGLLALCILVNWLAGRAIARSGEAAKGRWLGAVVVFDLVLLSLFKYADFFLLSLEEALQGLGLRLPMTTLGIILPVGLSFYLFQALSYVFDLRRGRIEEEPSLLTFATYIALWPQLVAGPIVRAHRLLPQLRQRRRFRWTNLLLGAEMIVFGLALKVVIADNLAPLADIAFEHPGRQTALFTLSGVIFFAFQIYGDFAGYSLIAIGFGRIMGLSFGVNFRRPYFASGFGDFWDRWHRSLSSWFRDYLYIPLGGGRHGRVSTLRNLTITMLLGGLWHGAALGFAFWGLLHALYLLLQHFTAMPIPRALRPLGVFLLVCLAWIPFRAETMEAARAVLFALAGPGLLDFAATPLKVLLVFGWCLIAALAFLEWLTEKPSLRRAYRRSRWPRLAFVLVILLALPLLGNFDGDAFIYFQF